MIPICPICIARTLAQASGHHAKIRVGISALDGYILENTIALMTVRSCPPYMAGCMHLIMTSPADGADLMNLEICVSMSRG